MTNQTFTANNATFTLMENLPVFMGDFPPAFNITKDWAPAVAEMRRILETQKEPLFFISDVRKVKLSLEDLIAVANMGSRGEDPIWRHPKIRAVYFITNSRIVEMAALGLRSPMFSNTAVKVFDTPEKALEDVRSMLAC